MPLGDSKSRGPRPALDRPVVPFPTGQARIRVLPGPQVRGDQASAHEQKAGRNGSATERHGRLSSAQRFCSSVETTGQSAEPPKFITPAENTFAPAAVR